MGIFSGHDLLLCLLVDETTRPKLYHLFTAASTSNTSAPDCGHVHPLTCETWSDQGTSDLLPVDESHFTAEENSWIFFGASDGSMGEQNPYGCMYVCMYVCMTSGKECGGVVNKLTGTCATSTASIGAGRAPVVLGEIFLENKISKSKSRILKPFFAP
jgi:hypothetical protein